MRPRRGHFHLALTLWFSAIPCCAHSAGEPVQLQSDSESALLDRLMASESGGRPLAKNPLSTALGPYQFIESTFLDIVRRKLPELTVGKSDEEICRLRGDPTISRRAALIYIRESAAFFAARNISVTPANLNLAFLAGHMGAARVLAAKPDEQVSAILSSSAIAANPWLAGLTARGLIERSCRIAGGLGAGGEDPPAKRACDDLLEIAPGSSSATQAVPRIAVLCNRRLPSCKKWIALAERRSRKVEAGLPSIAADVSRDDRQ
jgi:hypothetical protein